MDKYIARANIDHFLSVLNSSDLTAQNRRTIMKLLVAEEDRLSHDLEQLQFAEDCVAKSLNRKNHLTNLRDAFADGSTDRTRADAVLATFEETHQLTVHFYQRMREKADGQGI